MQHWYEIENVEKLDTPSLVFYKKRILHNIEHAIQWLDGDVERLRPHIKTFKSKPILEIFKGYGIKKVKTATVKETELAASVEMHDVLMAFQPHNSKLNRFIELVQKYPKTNFSTLVDNLETMYLMNEQAKLNNLVLNVFIDVNIGMNRTGFYNLNNLEIFVDELKKHKNLNFRGFHAYDGHLKNKDWHERTMDASVYYNLMREIIEKQNDKNNLEIVIGGSNTFPYYAKHTDAVCSPGTFVLWDENYLENLPEQKFLPASLIIGQVVSMPQPNHICIDIGTKAVSSEHTIDKRLCILNFKNLQPVSQSEEHFVFKHPENISISVGEIIYALPFHICPSVALYRTTHVVENHKIYEVWEIENGR